MQPYPQQFEAISAYDVPGVWLNQFATGRASPDALWATFSEGFLGKEGAVSPLDRAGPEGLLGWTPDTAIGRAMVNVATNPLTYFLLATELVVPKMAGTLFKTAPRLNAWLQESKMTPLLHQAGLSNLWHRLRGTPGAEAIDEVVRNTTEWGQAVNPKLKESLEGWLKSNNLKGLSLRAHAPGTAAYAKLEEATTLLKVYRGKLHRDVDEMFVVTNKSGDITTHIERRRALVNLSDGELQQRLDRLGLTGVAKSLDEAYDISAKMTFMDETGTKVDRNKLRRIYSSMAGDIYDNALPDNGNQALATMFGPEVANKIARGDITEASYEKMIDEFEKVLLHNKGHYSPKNTFTLRERNGQPARTGPNSNDEKGILEIAAGAHGRKPGQRAYDAEVLGLNADGSAVGPGTLERVFGSRVNADELFEQQEQYRKVLGIAAAERGGKFFTERLDEFESFFKYDNQMSRTYALYVKPPSARLLEAQQRKLAEVRADPEAAAALASREAYLRGPSGRFTDGEQAFKSFSEIDATKVPPGGFTNADMLQQTYSLLPGDSPTRELLKDNVIPRMLGVSTKEDFVTGAALTAQKGFARMVLNSPLRSMLEGVNKGDLVKQLDFMANSKLNAGTNYSYGLAQHFYGSLLGINLGAVLLNLTQPLLTTSRFVGIGDMAAGYRQGVSKYLEYSTEYGKMRARGNVSKMDALALRQKVFGDIADDAGILTDVQQEIIEGGISPGASIRLSTSFQSKLNEKLLIPFQQGEIFNRVVTAYAGQAAARRAGLSANATKDTVRRLVSESQFTSDLVSSPTAFLGEGILSNPLIRQFMTFPIRMLTSPFETGALLGGNAATTRGILRDFVRGAGVTAITVEAMRGLTGANVAEQVGFLENTFALPAQMFDQYDGPIPVPPVFRVVSGTAALVRGDDAEFYQRTLPLLVPGGLALQNLANIGFDFEQVPGLSSVNPQKRFVDWDAAQPDGTVPVFAADGRLIEYRSPASLVMQGLGARVDFSDADLDGYLLKQRENITQARAEYLRQIQANNPRAAREVATRFQQQYGIPLTVSKAQVQGFARLREEARTERILQQLPPGVREQFTEMVAATRGQALGIGPDQLQLPKDERDQLRQFDFLRRLSPESQQELISTLQTPTEPTDGPPSR